MAASVVWRQAQWHEPHPSEPWYPPPYTRGTPVPTLSKSPKKISFWSYSCVFVRFVQFVVQKCSAPEHAGRTGRFVFHELRLFEIQARFSPNKK